MRRTHTICRGAPRWALFVSVLVAAPLVATSAMAAGDVSANVDPKEVARGDRLRYSVSASVEGNHKISIEEDPDFGTAFKVVGTTNAPSFSMRNGRTHRSLTRTYQLRAIEKGEHTIEGPRVRIADATSRPEPVDVRVSATESRRDRRSRRRPTQRREERAFIDHSIEPEDAPYVGEQVLLHYFLFADAFRFKIEPAPPSEPDLDDFWIEDLSSKLSGQRRTMRIDGRLMERANLRSYALFPMRSGRIDIEPLTLEARTGGLLRSSDKVRLESDPIELDVKPLPPNAPDSFYEGNVGHWDFQVEADHKRAEMGEGITVEISVYGDGYLSRLEVPELPEIEGASIRHRSEDIEREASQRGVGGRRIHEYTITAEREGTLTIPAVEFSYFDPHRESYEKVRSEPIDIDIEGGTPPTSRDNQKEAPGEGDEGDEKAAPDDEEEAIEVLLSRLEPPDSEPSVELARRDFAKSRTFWILLALPLLGSLLVWLERPARRLWRRWLPGRRRGAAHRETLGRLDEAEESETADEALDLIRKALVTYMSRVAQIEPGSITEAELPARLEERGVDSELASRFQQLLVAFTEARYSPDVATKEARVDELLSEARACLEQLESRRRKKRWRPPKAAVILLAALAGALIAGGADTAHAADDVDALAERAAEAHQEEDWAESAELWEEIGRAHPHSPAVLYNLGTALAFDGQFGMARLVLERARLQAPLDDSFEPNRKVVEEIVQMRSAEKARRSGKSQAIFEEIFWWRLSTSLPSTVLGILLLLFVWVAFGALLVRRFSSNETLTEAAWNLLIAAVVAVALVAGAWYGRTQIIERIHPAVVLTDEITLHDGPSAHARIARTDDSLVAGTLVPASRERDGWVELSLGGEQTAWAKRDDIAPVQW